ncbi:MAG: hypothetical protein GEV13_10705 [Rhodospirillales bacterium]|nr:hypothetical protein [Rhodospirillales bacterium]
MTSYKDWVVETSSTTGTGAYSLSGSAPAGTSYFTFRQRYANGEDEVVYWVVNANRTRWEKNRFGTLTYGTPDTLSRNVVESTNGDAPVSWVGGDSLLIYCVPDSDQAEFSISMGLGTTRPDVLKYGQWADEDGLASDFDQLKHYDGTSDDVVGVVNRTAHQATIYGLPPGYLYGLTVSRSSATAIGIAAGTAMDSTNVVGIRIGSAITKSTAGSWVTGSAQNGMADGVTIGNNTWYHVFAGLADGVGDAFIDTSVSAANAPSEFSHFRRIGSFKTDGSAQIIAFTQTGDLFQWTTAPLDQNTVNLGSVGGSNNLTMSVPLGVAVRWQGAAQGFSAGTAGGWSLHLKTPGTTFGGGAMLAGFSAGGAGDNGQMACFAEVLTNTSSQIVVVSAAATSNVFITATTIGWIDSRGQDG